MDKSEPYIIRNDKNNNKKINKKNYEKDSDNEEEEEEEENESLSEISSKKIIEKMNNNSENKNIPKGKKPYDESQKELINLRLTKTKEKFNLEKLLKKIKDQEKELNDKNSIINDLRNEIQEKENKIKLITKTNNKLKNSMDEFSKKMDEKLFNNKNLIENLKKSKYKIKYNNYNDQLNQKELNNAMNMIKILKNDNLRLQNAIDNYEKINKMKELESNNKIKEDQNTNLENQIKILKKDLNKYHLCLKKCKIYERQIEILNKEIKTFKDNNKALKNKLSNSIQKNNSAADLLSDNKVNQGYISPRKLDNILYMNKNKNTHNLNTTRYKIKLNDNFISINNKDNYLKLNNNRATNLQKSMESLPTIVNKSKMNSKNNSPSGLNSYKKNFENQKDILKIFFNKEDIETINDIFKNNLNALESFKLKLCIINKSKESLNNRYNIEIKKYNERIKSAQEQIEYLNNKIRESEVNYRVLQTQMNEFDIQKRLLLKKIKKLEQNLIEKDNLLKLNLIGEENNNKINNENKKNENYSNENSENNESSKISNEIESDNNSDSDKSNKNTENNRVVLEKK